MNGIPSGLAHLVALDPNGRILALSEKFNPFIDGSVSMEVEHTGIVTRMVVKGDGWTYDASHMLRGTMVLHKENTFTLEGKALSISVEVS